MAYTLYVEPHPLGIVVCNAVGDRELLIDGERCCGVGFETLKQAAFTTRRIEVDEESAANCRLIQPPFVPR